MLHRSDRLEDHKVMNFRSTSLPPPGAGPVVGVIAVPEEEIVFLLVVVSFHLGAYSSL